MKAISLLGNTTECISNASENKSSDENKKGPNWSSMPLADPCSDSLSELAEFDFQLLQDNIALMEEEGKFAKEILDVTKFTLDVKNKSKDNKPESLNLKPNFDLHLAKMQAIADRFTAPKPEVDSKRYQVENVSLKLNGKTTKLKHFILGFEGDFTINLNEFSEENITNNTQDKLLFGGAQASKKELLAVHGTKKDVKTVYDYLSPKKGKLTGKHLKEIFKEAGTSQARCDEVAKLINKYADEYGLTSNERLAHFIGQIGAETQLKKLSEESYSASVILTADKTRTLRTHNGKKVLKYCSLYEGYGANGTGCPYPYCDKDIIVPEGSYSNNYAATSFMKNAGLTVKAEMIDERPRDPEFFNTIYGCQADSENLGIESGDGFRFRGRGFLQITGHYNYKTKVQDKWDAVHGKGTKDFMCRSIECDKNLDAIADDLDFSMLISLTFWKNGNTNDKANVVNDDSIETVTKAVNGRLIGIDHRTKYTNKAYEVLNK